MQWGSWAVLRENLLSSHLTEGIWIQFYLGGFWEREMVAFFLFISRKQRKETKENQTDVLMGYTACLGLHSELEKHFYILLNKLSPTDVANLPVLVALKSMAFCRGYSLCALFCSQQELWALTTTQKNCLPLLLLGNLCVSIFRAGLVFESWLTYGLFFWPMWDSPWQMPCS